MTAKTPPKPGRKPTAPTPAAPVVIDGAEAFDRLGESQGVMDVDIHLGVRRDAMVRLVKLHNNMSDYLEEFPDDTINRRPEHEDKAEKAPAGGEAVTMPSMGDI